MKAFNLIPWSVLWVYVFLFVLEYVVARYKKIDHFNGPEYLSNIGCSFLHLVSELLNGALTVIVYTFLFQYLAMFELKKGFSEIMISFLLIDFLDYWVHRLNHRFKIFWAIHIVHHQSKYFNFSAGPRISIFNKLGNFPIFIVCAACGMDPTLFTIIGFIEVSYMFILHTKVFTWPRWMEYVLNTPNLHEAHHAKNPKYIDKNFGGILSIWDRLFGTWAVNEGDVILGVEDKYYSLNPIKANFLYLFDLMKPKVKKNNDRTVDSKDSEPTLNYQDEHFV